MNRDNIEKITKRIEPEEAVELWEEMQGLEAEIKRLQAKIERLGRDRAIRVRQWSEQQEEIVMQYVEVKRLQAENEELEDSLRDTRHEVALLRSHSVWASGKNRQFCELMQNLVENARGGDENEIVVDVDDFNAIVREVGDE